MMENINNFQKGLKAYGVPEQDFFQTVDLYEKKDISQVTNTLFALGRAVSYKKFKTNYLKVTNTFFLFLTNIQTWKDASFGGPNLGPKPADECKRDFTEEQLNAGQTMIGLQAGSNKGATQAGSNMGAGRKILLGK